MFVLKSKYDKVVAENVRLQRQQSIMQQNHADEVRRLEAKIKALELTQQLAGNSKSNANAMARTANDYSLFDIISSPARAKPKADSIPAKQVSSRSRGPTQRKDHTDDDDSYNRTSSYRSSDSPTSCNTDSPSDNSSSSSGSSGGCD